MSKFRNPISCFFVHKDYYLQVYKIDTSYKYLLTNTIKISYDDASLRYFTGYYLDDFTEMEFLYKATKPQKPINIYIDLYGENTKTLMKNDSIAYYFSKCKSFSLGFNKNESFDIHGQPKDGILKKTIDLEMLLFKRKSNLFMLTLSAKDADGSLKPWTLYNLFLNDLEGSLRKKLKPKTKCQKSPIKIVV
ncbi:hypothetical protein [Mucilaginibacter sp.]